VQSRNDSSKQFVEWSLLAYGMQTDRQTAGRSAYRVSAYRHTTQLAFTTLLSVLSSANAINAVAITTFCTRAHLGFYVHVDILLQTKKTGAYLSPIIEGATLHFLCCSSPCNFNNGFLFVTYKTRSFSHFKASSPLLGPWTNFTACFFHFYFCLC